MSITSTEPITVSTGVHVGVSTVHGNNWFPLHIEAGLWASTLYLRRAQLHALRLRLDEIDDTFSDPGDRE